ncbi:hypothetical protein NORO109296_19460 [Nocardiopsis rhodophaea]
MNQGPFTCRGTIEPFGDAYVITYTECVVPLPTVTVTLGPDGETLTVTAPGESKTETWQLLQRPE